jgi:predicted PurR-regulated permease PerM
MLHSDMESYRRRVLFTVGITALAVILIFFLWRVANIVLLAFVGLLFAVLLLTVANFLSRHTPLKGRWSLLVTLLFILALLVGVGWWTGPRLANQFDQLTQRVSQPIQQLEETLAQYRWGDWLLRQAPLLEQPTGDEGATPAAGGEESPSGGEAAAPRGGEQASGTGVVGGQLLSGLTGAVSTLANFLVNVIFVVFVGIFLAAQPKLYQDGVVRLFPLARRERAREVMDELFRTLQGWLLGQLLAMLIVGVLTGIGLWALGIPLVLALAFLAFLFEFIPMIGPWLAGIPAVLLAFSQGPTQVLWVVLLYVVIQQLEGNIIYPLAEQRTVHLPPALTLFAIFVMGTLFGLVGLLAATPLVAVILVFVKRVYVKDTLGEPSSRDPGWRAT